MHDFSETSFFKKWTNDYFLYELILTLLVNFIHLAIYFFGLKSINLLTRKLFRKKKNKDTYLSDEKIQYLASNTRPLLKKIRKNQWLLSNCLSSSLAFWILLYLQGLETELVIGCKKKKNLKAHAWVELNGIALNAGKQVRKKYETFPYNFSVLNF